MDGAEDDLAAAPSAQADAGAPLADAETQSQALTVVPPLPQAASTPGVQRYVAIVGGVVLAGVATMALLSTRSSARESLPPGTGDSVVQPQRHDTSAVPRTQAAIFPHWSNAHQSRWVSNHPKSAAFELRADRDVPVWMHRVEPLLVVRCLAHKADVFVFTDSPARIEPQDENHTVTIAFDDEAASTERWMDSEEHDSLFAPDGAAFARRLTQSHTLRFGFTPHNAAPVTVQFTTKGFDNVFTHIAEKCRM